MFRVPRSHPRYESLVKRERLAEGVRAGITSLQGLIAHGRGEAFDYLIGERTLPPAFEATRAAVATLLLAERPVLSVNGNVAALVPSEIVELSRLLDAPLEINIFYRTEERVRRIKEHLLRHGAPADRVLGDEPDALIPGLEHARARATRRGIYGADVVLTPLEDGDRCEALVRMGKKVITIDLNPLSRTARAATVTIVDDITRAVNNMIRLVAELKGKPRGELEKLVESFDNKENLRAMLRAIAERLTRLDVIELD
ncbi:MAG: 4-phosphopantoate--beta-alanine ligase [Candidatus Alkanophagales archaeon]